MKTLEQISLEFGYNPIEFSKQYVEHLINLLKSIDHSAISKCISILENARKNDNTIFVIGNGGSASTASHIGNDFGLAVLKRSENKLLKSYRVLALTDNNSVMSAIGNDSNFNDILGF